jgi:hypothetical protein
MNTKDDVRSHSLTRALCLQLQYLVSSCGAMEMMGVKYYVLLHKVIPTVIGEEDDYEDEHAKAEDAKAEDEDAKAEDEDAKAEDEDAKAEDDDYGRGCHESDGGDADVEDRTSFLSDMSQFTTSMNVKLRQSVYLDATTLYALAGSPGLSSGMMDGDWSYVYFPSTGGFAWIAITNLAVFTLPRKTVKRALWKFKFRCIRAAIKQRLDSQFDKEIAHHMLVMLNNAAHAAPTASASGGIGDDAVTEGVGSVGLKPTSDFKYEKYTDTCLVDAIRSLGVKIP